MAYQFKVGDTGKTRDGRAYRVIATDVESPEPIAVVIQDGPGEEYVASRYPDGTQAPCGELCGDLIPPTPAVYINVYEDSEIFAGRAIHDSRDAADKNTSDGVPRVGCIRVPLEARYDD